MYIRGARGVCAQQLIFMFEYVIETHRAAAMAFVWRDLALGLRGRPLRRGFTIPYTLRTDKISDRVPCTEYMDWNPWFAAHFARSVRFSYEERALQEEQVIRNYAAARGLDALALLGADPCNPFDDEANKVGAWTCAFSVMQRRHGWSGDMTAKEFTASAATLYENHQTLREDALKRRFALWQVTKTDVTLQEKDLIEAMHGVGYLQWMLVKKEDTLDMVTRVRGWLSSDWEKAFRVRMYEQRTWDAVWSVAPDAGWATWEWEHEVRVKAHAEELSWTFES